MRECERAREISGRIERKHCSKRQNDKTEGEKEINRVKMKERERVNRGGRERWTLQRPLFLEIDTIMPVDWSWSLSEHVIAKPGWSASVRGLVSGCFRTSCTDSGPNTSSHTHMHTHTLTYTTFHLHSRLHRQAA